MTSMRRAFVKRSSARFLSPRAREATYPDAQNAISIAAPGLKLHAIALEAESDRFQQMVRSRCFSAMRTVRSYLQRCQGYLGLARARGKTCPSDRSRLRGRWSCRFGLSAADANGVLHIGGI